MIRTLILDWAGVFLERAVILRRARCTPSPRWGRQSRREGRGEGAPRSIGCTPLTLALSAALPPPAGTGDIPSQPQMRSPARTLRSLAFVVVTTQPVHA